MITLIIAYFVTCMIMGTGKMCIEELQEKAASRKRIKELTKYYQSEEYKLQQKKEREQKRLEEERENRQEEAKRRRQEIENKRLEQKIYHLPLECYRKEEQMTLDDWAKNKYRYEERAKAIKDIKSAGTQISLFNKTEEITEEQIEEQIKKNRNKDIEESRKRTKELIESYEKLLKDIDDFVFAEKINERIEVLKMRESFDKLDKLMMKKINN